MVIMIMMITKAVLKNHFFRFSSSLSSNSWIFGYKNFSSAASSSSTLVINNNNDNESNQFHHSQKLPSRQAGRLLPDGPPLEHFLQAPYITKRSNFKTSDDDMIEPYLDWKTLHGDNAKVFIKTYGCQMNVNDTEIVSTILRQSGYQLTSQFQEANIVLLMTCAIRENAELKVWNKLHELSRWKQSGNKTGGLKQFGLLGCMAERLKTKLLQQLPTIDIIAGPDSYRALPKLLAINRLTGQSAVNVLLSLHETYDEVLLTNTNAENEHEDEITSTTTTNTLSSSLVDTPRVGSQTNRTSAFVSITRGCDNMCSYCIVPFTRGRERSRPIDSILSEIDSLVNGSGGGVKEITLLGQNVNSYRDFSRTNHPSSSSSSSSSSSLPPSLPSAEPVKVAPGFSTIYRPKQGGEGFDRLLDLVATTFPHTRIRFTSPHPKDFTEKVLEVIAQHPNIAKGIHMPAQSGSNAVLERMRRGYTREAYLALVDRIYHMIPHCAVNSDFICGFCDETEHDHAQTLDLLERVRYRIAYIFAYSMRDRTHAAYRLEDNVPIEVKLRRTTEAHAKFREVALAANQAVIGTEQLILLEGRAKKQPNDSLYGRNEANQKVVIPRWIDTTTTLQQQQSIINNDDDDPMIMIENKNTYVDNDNKMEYQIGDFVRVRITECTPMTLIGVPLGKCSIKEFYH